MEVPPQFGDYDPRAWLERSGTLFLHYRCFVAAAGAFSRLLAVERTNSLAWYGLANALYCLSGQRRDVGLLRDAVSCMKRAVQIDPANKLATELLEAIPQRTPLSHAQVTGVEAFETLPAELSARIGFTVSTFAEAMRAIPGDGERMQIVMWLGMLNEPCATEILLAAVDDSDPHVRMAALKRLDASADDPRLAAKMQQLAFSDAGRECEPYLSMALNRFASATTAPDHWAARVLAALNKDSH